jgi:PBP1b-binding outer membrane lipoprotein LpoB
MRVKVMSIILASFILLVGCASTKEETVKQETSNNQEEVIKTYFAGYEERDAEKIYTTLTDSYKKQHPISDFTFEHIKSMKLLSVKEITEGNGKFSVHDYRREGINMKAENIKEYDVEFERIFVDDTVTSAPSGIDHYFFTLFREDNTSDWLIYSMGR